MEISFHILPKMRRIILIQNRGRIQNRCSRNHRLGDDTKEGLDTLILARKGLLSRDGLMKKAREYRNDVSSGIRAAKGGKYSKLVHGGEEVRPDATIKTMLIFRTKATYVPTISLLGKVLVPESSINLSHDILIEKLQERSPIPPAH